MAISSPARRPRGLRTWMPALLQRTSRRQLRQLVLAVVCVVLLYITVPAAHRSRKPAAASVNRDGGASVHEALRSHNVHVDLGDPNDPRAPQRHDGGDAHAGDGTTDEAAGDAIVHHVRTMAPAPPTPAPHDAVNDAVDDEATRAAKLQEAFQRADATCRVSDGIVDSLEALLHAHFSGYGGDRDCTGHVVALRQELPILRTAPHPLCATAVVPMALLPKRNLVPLEGAKRRAGKRVLRIRDLWPSLKAHITNIDYMLIDGIKRRAPFRVRRCAQMHHPGVSRYYFDVGPTERGGDGSSLEWFVRNYPEAHTFHRIFAIGDAERLAADVHVAEELLEEARVGAENEAPAREPGRHGAHAVADAPEFKKHHVTDQPLRGGVKTSNDIDLSSRVQLVHGLGWNDTGWITQQRLVPLPAANLDADRATPAPPKAGSGRGGRIDIVLGPTPPPEDATDPPRFPTRNDTGVVDDPADADPLLPLLNDRMLPTVFHSGRSDADEVALAVQATALQDAFTRQRYKWKARTVPAVDVSELILRHAQRDDFVVLRLNAVGFEWQILERLAVTGAFKYVDELLLVCRSTELNIGWNTPTTPADCQNLFNTLRGMGVYAHEWLPY